jgi:hypothetical protein
VFQKQIDWEISTVGDHGEGAPAVSCLVLILVNRRAGRGEAGRQTAAEAAVSWTSLPAGEGPIRAAERKNGRHTHGLVSGIRLASDLRTPSAAIPP